MLKTIALAGFFFAASALTPPFSAPAPKPQTPATTPTAPTPQGFCPFYGC
jgi:hypothetical protein